LSTPDSKLTWSDFQILLGPHLPAGSYEEVAYFLPLAFDHIRARQEDALDLCTTLTWFCSTYSKQLASDGVVESARQSMADLLRRWTATFDITHFDEAACRAKGWGIKYSDYVQRSETVYQTLCDFTEYVEHSDLAEYFMEDLSAFGRDPIKAAWLLDLVRSREEPYHPPLTAATQKCAADTDLLQRAFDCVAATGSLWNASPTYWYDTARILTLRGNSER
jgi:hypothetical protein